MRTLARVSVPKPVAFLSAAVLAGTTALLLRQLARQATVLGRRELELNVTVERLYLSELDLAHQARHDALTGLPNRVLFGEHLEHIATRSLSRAVMILDLDGFETINDSLGHPAGDALLVELAGRLARSVRPIDMVARFGGDAFTILVVDLSDEDAADAVRRIMRVFDEPVKIDDRQVSVRASLGIATDRDGSQSSSDLLRDADTAMHEAKRRGRGRFEVFNPEMHAGLLERLALECDLRTVTFGSELTLHYQPVVDLHDGRIAGFEALLRWFHPERGQIPPATFIPIAEETGLIVAIGNAVTEAACFQGQLWRETLPDASALTMSVNVSARQLADLEFVDVVARALQRSGLDPACLTLEITETMIMSDEDSAAACLQGLKKLGVRISVDDFGTGYSSLRHLRRFPVDELKIDQSFVASMGTDGDSGVAVAAIRLARDLHLQIVAEGIERDDQIVELRRAGCALGQGFYLSEPLDAASAGQLLERSLATLIPLQAPLNVLVVDDDDDLRQNTCLLLEHAGFDSVAAASGHQALHLAKNCRIDAVLLDVDLPDIDGLAVCRELRKTQRSLPIAQMSGWATKVEDRVSGLDAGADAYLIKPVSSEEVVATLNAILRRSDALAATT
jgi:diguanylate cyclase (GGDEF)-like protein